MQVCVQGADPWCCVPSDPAYRRPACGEHHQWRAWGRDGRRFELRVLRVHIDPRVISTNLWQSCPRSRRARAVANASPRRLSRPSPSGVTKG